MSESADRSGRPPQGDGQNRDRILRAARGAFAEAGFAGASLRSIAARAQVDVALVAHYFGNKNDLFAASMQLPPGAPDHLLAALSTPREGQGERLSRSYFELWEDPATSEQLKVVGRSALTNETASTRLRSLLTGTFTQPEFAAAISGREVGFTLAMTHLFGVALGRYLIGVPPLAELDFETLVTRTGAAVQLHLDG